MLQHHNPAVPSSTWPKTWIQTQWNDKGLRIKETGLALEIVTIGENGITRDDDGNVFVVSFSGSKIIKITPEGETSVFADSGGNGIGHIVFLRGVFYATSYIDNKIYRVLPNGKLTLFAGTGERADKDGPVADAAFSNPNGIAAIR